MKSNSNRLINVKDGESGDNSRPYAPVPRNDNVYDQEHEENGSKRKKWFIYGGIGAVIVVVIIILAVVLGKKGGGDQPDPGPGPGPGPTPVPHGFNPYVVEEGSIMNESARVTGVLTASNQPTGGYAIKLPDDATSADIIELTSKLTTEPSRNDYGSFKRKGIKSRQSKPRKLSAFQDSNGTKFGVDDEKIPVGANNMELKNVRFEFGQVSRSTVMMILEDNNTARWEPPRNLVGWKGHDDGQRLAMSNFKLNMNPFSFEIGSTYTGKTLITTQNMTCYLMDKYMQVDFLLPSQNLYGLGERKREFKLSQGTWTMWANGQETPYDDGTGMKQTYGVHPFVLVQATDAPDQFLGMWFRNTNGMSPVITHREDGTSIFSYITIGGKVHAYFFMQGTAKQIITRYQEIAGKPRLPPFWALGWHSSSYSYQTFEDMKKNVQAYNDNKIPLDGVWFDIPYMEDYADFSVDTTGKFKFDIAVAEQWQKENKKLIPIIDAGLSNTKESKYVPQALTQNLLIKKMGSDDPIEQFVWPKSSVFLDWFNPKVYDIWEQGLSDLFDQLPFDGIWLDMNEVTAFCNGDLTDTSKQCLEMQQKSSKKIEEFAKFLQEGGPAVQMVAQKVYEDDDTNTTWYTSYDKNMTEESTYFLPFIPSVHFNFDNMTLSLNATHPSTNYTQYDTHSLFGHMQAKITFDVLSTPEKENLKAKFYNKRQFVLSRSTFSGSGKYTSHWLGDNHRGWDDMRYSIAGIMNFNMFGIPHVGADVCGFFANDGVSEDENKEICGRWMQLATFYPFARQHRNATGGEPNEPYNLGDYKEMAVSSIKERYKWMMFMYTCLNDVEWNGGTCFDPMLFHYPHINETFSMDIESTFIVGDAIKVSPVLKRKGNETRFKSWFPKGDWLSLDGSYQTLSVKQNGNVDLPYPDKTVQAHLRPGYIVPMQDATNVMSAADLATADYSLIINRDEQGSAQGRLYMDNGQDILDAESTSESYTLNFAKSVLSVFTDYEKQRAQGKSLKQIIIGNAPDLQDMDFACYMNTDESQFVQLEIAKDSEKKTVTLSHKDGGITLKNVQMFNFGNSARDTNLCIDNGAKYAWVNPNIDLSGNVAKAVLTSSASSSVYPDLEFTMTLKNFSKPANESIGVNLHWTYKNATGMRRIYEVPQDIVNTMTHEKASNTTSLSKFVVLGKSASEPLLKIMNDNGTVVYELKSVMLGDFINIINGQALVYGKGAEPNTDFKGIMGLAERTVTDLWLPTGIYTIWTRDCAASECVEDGKLPGKGIYGAHPFYMAKAQDNSWFGVYTNLAAAQDWWINNSPTDGTVGIKTYAAGGLGDVTFMFGKTPDSISLTYQNFIVGNPVLVPQWALGWNNCKYGYKSSQEVAEVIGNYSLYGFPLETQWVDIDYLDTYEDFTYDKTAFGSLPSVVADLHSKNMHFVPIIDAGIAKRPGSAAYEEGVRDGVFMKAYDNKTDFVGQVWPGDALFPDWTKNATTAPWWWRQLDSLYSLLPFDGLWEDMNEASSFGGGASYPEQADPASARTKLTYVPGGRRLDDRGLDIDAMHSDGFSEVDVHSLFGTMQVRATHEWFQNRQNRTMIIERSAFAGLGKFGSRWLGDNNSSAYMMGTSVTGTMMQNILGIPLTGADICGFLENTTAELCARWHILGGFYPFSRNHNALGFAPQEPWVWKDTYYTNESTLTYMDVMRQGPQNKMSMIRYYYTQLSLISQGVIPTLFKPAFFEFPDEAGAYLDPENNIMLGSALKLSMVTNALGQNTHPFYFGSGSWCNVFNVHLGTESCFAANPGGQEGITKVLSTKVFEFHVHLRDGHIIPWQDGAKLLANTTADLQAQPVELHIHGSAQLPEFLNFTATGVYLNDDGVVLDVAGKQNVYHVDYLWDQKVATITINATATADDHAESTICAKCVNNNDKLGKVQIYNAKAASMDKDKPFTVEVKGTESRLLGAIANYDKQSDRVVIDFSGTDVFLPLITEITLKL